MRFLLPELEVRPRPMGEAEVAKSLTAWVSETINPSSGLLQARRTVLLIYSTRGGYRGSWRIPQGACFTSWWRTERPSGKGPGRSPRVSLCVESGRVGQCRSHSRYRKHLILTYNSSIGCDTDPRPPQVSARADSPPTSPPTSPSSPGPSTSQIPSRSRWSTGY